jgi:hypothetical protein
MESTPGQKLIKKIRFEENKVITIKCDRNVTSNSATKITSRNKYDMSPVSNKENNRNFS